MVELERRLVVAAEAGMPGLEGLLVRGSDGMLCMGLGAAGLLWPDAAALAKPAPVGVVEDVGQCVCGSGEGVVCVCDSLLDPLRVAGTAAGNVRYRVEEGWTFGKALRRLGVVLPKGVV
jgi:hypothetical protein